MWDELTILWNDLTILWNDLTIDWNDLTWNDMTMERNDRIPTTFSMIDFDRLVTSWTRQHRDFRSNQDCPSLEAYNSAGKITPGLNSSTHSKQRCCSSMSIHSIRNTSHRSLAMLLSLARSASEFRISFFRCRVDVLQS